MRAKVRAKVRARIGQSAHFSRWSGEAEMKIGTWCSGGDATEIQSQPVPLSTIRCFVTLTHRIDGVLTNQ